MHERHEPGAVAGGGVLQHLQIAIGIAKGHDRTAPKKLINPNRLARAVVDGIHLGQLDQHRRAIHHFELGFPRGTDDLMGRDAIGLLGEGAHELHPTARDDEGDVAVRAQIVEQFEHRFERGGRIRALIYRMLGSGDPVAHDFAEVLGRDPRMGGRHQREDAFHPGLAERGHVA